MPYSGGCERSAILSGRRQDLRQGAHWDGITRFGCGSGVAMRHEQERRGGKDEKVLLGEPISRLPGQGAADQAKHGPISGTDLILKNLLLFGSAVLVISVVLYLIF